MDRDELRRLLRSSYVLFSCEGTAEAVCIQKLVDAEATPTMNGLRSLGVTGS